MKRFSRLVAVAGLTASVTLVALWAYTGDYGLHVLLRHGGTWWLDVGADSTRLSPSMRLALGAAPVAVPGEFEWRVVAPGFETADLPARVGGLDVDHVLLARIDPARFRFVVRNAADGTRNLDQWMARLGAALVVNGSYYARDGRPDTPFLSDGDLLGPRDYDAKAGAFVATADAAGLRDLADTDWRTAVRGAQDAMVSYPLLVAGGKTRVARASRWLANRSFVGQDETGRVIVGTTTDAFFTLDRFARFLLGSPLDLSLALNLDGGPVASQGVSLNGFERRSYGRWEAQAEEDRVRLLSWPYGTIPMPVVLAVYPK